MDDWKKWCRICGYKKFSEIENTIDLINIDENIVLTIKNYFGIMITPKINGCSKICVVCNDMINSIVKFNDHVEKVHKMFLDLESNGKLNNMSLNELREIYGLRNEIDVACDYGIVRPLWCSQDENSLKCKIEDNFDNLEYKDKVHENVNEMNDTILFLEKSNLYSDQNYKEPCKTTEKVENGLEEDEKVKIEKNLLNSIIDVPFENENKFKKKNLECEICTKKFKTSKGRTIHLKKKHLVKQGPPFKCSTCGRVFKRFQQLNIHESIHLSQTDRKYYDCPKCDKKFVSEWYVQDHVRIVHEGDKRFICELCGAAFGTNKNLLDHHLTHSIEKKFQCAKCNKAFKCKRTLKFHVETHDETDYPCHLCGLKLNTKRILRRHMIVHSDENKYKCNFCSKQFKRQYEFKNHLLLHTGLKLYQCMFCELSFSNGSNCRKHQKALHPNDLANAESKGTLMLVENVPSFKQLVAANEEALFKTKI